MNTLVTLLSSNTQNANKDFRTWYESKEEEFKLPFSTFIMYESTFLQAAVFRCYFTVVHNIDFVVFNDGYVIYAARYVEGLEKDFRFTYEDGIYYLEKYLDKPIPEDYNQTLYDQYKYWNIKVIFEVFKWINNSYR